MRLSLISGRFGSVESSGFVIGRLEAPKGGLRVIDGDVGMVLSHARHPRMRLAPCMVRLCRRFFRHPSVFAKVIGVSLMRMEPRNICYLNFRRILSFHFNRIVPFDCSRSGPFGLSCIVPFDFDRII